MRLAGPADSKEPKRLGCFGFVMLDVRLRQLFGKVDVVFSLSAPPSANRTVLNVIVLSFSFVSCAWTSWCCSSIVGCPVVSPGVGGSLPLLLCKVDGTAAASLASLLSLEKATVGSSRRWPATTEREPAAAMVLSPAQHNKHARRTIVTALSRLGVVRKGVPRARGKRAGGADALAPRGRQGRVRTLVGDHRGARLAVAVRELEGRASGGSSSSARRGRRLQRGQTAHGVHRLGLGQ
eukprot:scaffold1705_cov304-Prasinococcus_capsulatus_cf.AAC.8